MRIIDPVRGVARTSLQEALKASERAFTETGHYYGLRELALKNQNPLRFESFHTRLSSAVVSARETSRKISASPGVREVGESVVALYTADGDSIALSTGIVVHVHTMSRFIKWMIEQNYEDDPQINPGDIFVNNDPFVSDVHPPDLMTVIPLFWEGELIGWAGAVCHEIEIGGIVGGANMGVTAERFGNGLTVTAEKVGTNDTIRKDYWLRAEYNLRTPIYWILDQKSMVSACLDVRERVYELIREFGVDYYRRASRELIEEARRAHLERVKLMTVPGRYRVPAFSGHLLKGKPGVSPLSDDLLANIPLEVRIGTDGFMEIDLEGIGPENWTPFNCSLTAADGVLFVGLTQFMNNDGRVNDGAWHALKFNIPPGSWCNPESRHTSIGGIWSMIMPTFGAWMRAMSRAFLARGYKEEVFLGMVTTPIVEGGGINQYGQRFGGQNLECAAEGSGARGIMDGIDNGYVGWNPESDMGNVEIWELYLPILYLGRRILRDSYGWGRYRGGATQSSIYLIHRSPLYAIMSTIHSDLVFDNAGMCGGYPAPTARYHYTVKDSDAKARAQERLPLPHVEGDPNNPEMKALLGGRFDVEKGFYHRPLADGDVFEFFYNSGGGYGDPIERDPELIQRDFDNGLLSPQMAQNVYKAVSRYNADEDRHEIDLAATEALRQQTRTVRKQKAIPVAQWYARTRERVAQQAVAPLVAQMYADSMRMSEKWRAEFISFWQLDPEFRFTPQAE